MKNINKVEIYQICSETIERHPQIGMYPYSDKGIEILKRAYKCELYDYLYSYSVFCKSSTESLLEDVLYHGNNDDSLCDNLYRSISPGDIIVVNSEPYMVLPLGFRKI